MQQFNVHEARSDLSKLLDMARKGEEVIISRTGTPVARLPPILEAKPVAEFWVPVAARSRS